MRTLGMAALAVTLCTAGCGTERLEGRGVEEEVAMSAAPVAPVVDSAVTVREALARFRADIHDVPTGLRGGGDSPEALTREVVRRLANADTSAFAGITVDRAEFAWLYYETSPLAKAPYELPPALMWFQLQQGNRTALFRLLRELGGRGLEYEGLVCDPDPLVQGENRLWSGCRARLAVDGESRELRLFGAMLERGGRVKMLSYDNDF
jgi:hypothetical protein